jgi:flagellar hook-associated protein 2
MSKSAFSAFSVNMAPNSGISVVPTSSAKAGSYNVRVEQIATAATMRGHRLTEDTAGLTDAELRAGIGGLTSLAGGAYTGDAFGGFSFTINGHFFDFTSSDSLSEIMDEVNRSGAGVTMSYTQATDRITIISNATGENSKVEFEDQHGFLAHLGLTETVAGQDAIVYLNGEEEPQTLSSNSITIDGTVLTFMRASGETGVDFSLETDHTPAMNRIRTMVSAFNDLFKELYEAFNEKDNRDFRPLTEEQRAELTEREIDTWESRAKEGLLRRDNTLGRLMTNMQRVMTHTFDAGTLRSIGISSSGLRVGEATQWIIDEEKLLAALEEDSSRVHDIFAELDDRDGNGGGLMVRLNRMMDEYVNSIAGRDLQNLNNNIFNYTRDIKEQENKLTVMSERYYMQYARLETALSQMMGQQDYVATMFGWGNQQ